MIPFIALLSLAAVLQQSYGNVDFDSESPRKIEKQKEIVDMHNAFRRSVNPTASNMLRMKWLAEAAANAEHWASKCIYDHSPKGSRVIKQPAYETEAEKSASGKHGILKRDQQCGENIYMSSVPMTWADIIQSWYDEHKNFTYGVGASIPDAAVGHYTQIVWYNSFIIGCAAARCPSDKYNYLYVCQYCSVGNVGGYAVPYNSGPTCGDCRSACENGLCTNPCTYGNDYTNCNSLAQQGGCKLDWMKANCSAACFCHNEII